MAVLTSSWLGDLLLITASLLSLLYWYLSRPFSYFRVRGIPFLSPTPLVGHLGTFTLSQMELSASLYSQFPGERFFGYFQGIEPIVLIKDPDLVHRIMVKDFTHFYDRKFGVIEGDLLSKNLFHLKGQTWRSLRNKLSPTFSTGKLKQMFTQFQKSAENMLCEIEEIRESGKAADAKLLSMNFTTEVIASTAFGLNFSKDNPQTVEFIKRMNNVFISGAYLVFVVILSMFGPKLLKLLPISHYTPGTTDYFLSLTKATKAFRRANKVERNDYFQLLLKLQEAEENGTIVSASATDHNEEDNIVNQMEFTSQSTIDRTNRLLTDEGVTAQAFSFLMGGTESVAGTLSFALYHVAKDPVVQRRLTEELKSVVSKHGWSYQAVKEMVYLDRILQETLRLYPPLPLTLRECTVPYQIPDSTVVLEKGVVVAVPVAGLHMDPKHHPSPHTFDPDRFADNNHKPSSTYLPFGDGPRICIAMRFALVEMKLYLATILSKYSVHVDSKTVEPLTFDRKSFTPKPVGGIWLTFDKKKDAFP